VNTVIFDHLLKSYETTFSQVRVSVSRCVDAYTYTQRLKLVRMVELHSCLTNCEALELFFNL
jgi:hypothetical protein